MSGVQDVQLLFGERGFKTIREPDEKFFACDCRGAGDHALRAAWMNQGVVCPAHFDQGNDLCSGKNVVRLVGHDG